MSAAGAAAAAAPLLLVGVAGTKRCIGRHVCFVPLTGCGADELANGVRAGDDVAHAGLLGKGAAQELDGKQGTWEVLFKSDKAGGLMPHGVMRRFRTQIRSGDVLRVRVGRVEPGAAKDGVSPLYHAADAECVAMRVQSNTGVERYVDGGTLVEIPAAGRAPAAADAGAAGAAVAAASRARAQAAPGQFACGIGATGDATGEATSSKGALAGAAPVEGAPMRVIASAADEPTPPDGSNDCFVDASSDSEDAENDNGDDGHVRGNNDGSAVLHEADTAQHARPRHPPTRHCSERANVFCDWLVGAGFGLRELLGDVATLGGGVLDVAGGKGELSLALTMAGVRAVLVDPRVGRLSRRQRKALRRSDRVPFEAVHTLFGGPAPADDARTDAIIRDAKAVVVVGLHPDEATDAIVDAAVSRRLPFAVVPCCVYSRLFPHRRLASTGAAVTTHPQLCEYLLDKHPAARAARLGFPGTSNVVVYCRDYGSPPVREDSATAAVLWELRTAAEVSLRPAADGGAH